MGLWQDRVATVTVGGSKHYLANDEAEHVTLVNSRNHVVGSCNKLVAHRQGTLHRAFSILISNPDGEMLLQRRAEHKYHFAKRWSNSCCGHPRPGEQTHVAASRRLEEEFGFSTSLQEVAELQYRAVDPDSGLTEHEHLHIFQGCYAGEPAPNPQEIGAYCWMQPNTVRRSLARFPGTFTPWFALLAAKLELNDCS